MKDKKKLSILLFFLALFTTGCNGNNATDKAKYNEEVIEKNIMGTTLIENKYYFLVGTSTGKTAAISFKNNGTCMPLFSGLNNSSISGDFMVVYDISNNDCKYTVNKENKTISIDWYGTVTTEYHFKDGYGKYNSSIIGQKYIMKDIIVKEGMNNSLVAVNGNWDLQNIEGAFLIYFLKNEDQTTNDNINKEDQNNIGQITNDDKISETVQYNNDDQENNDTQYNNFYPVNDNLSNNNEINSNREKTYEEEQKEINNMEVDNLSIINIFPGSEFNKYYVGVCSYGVHYLQEIVKEIYINGEQIPIDKACPQGNNEYRIEEEGEICVDVKIIGLYGKERVYHECNDWKAEVPSFKVLIYIGTGDKKFINIITQNGSYNTLGRLKIYVNDVEISQSSEIEGWASIIEKETVSPDLYVSPGTYTIKLVNRYGLSVEKTITIS